MEDDYTKDVDEPEVEEMKNESEELETEPEVEIKEEVIKVDKGYRRKIKRFPLDHSVKCGNCGYKGKVVFNELYCPQCYFELIKPKNVK